VKRLTPGLALALLAVLLAACGSTNSTASPSAPAVSEPDTSEPGAVASAGAPTVPTLISPEVNDNGSVTLRLYSPDAISVTADGDIGNQILTPNGNGVWSATTGPLDPAIYSYHLIVDGAQMSDPANPDRKGAAESLVTVSGNPPLPWELRDVPHGSITPVAYQSGVFDDQRRYVVYTPPGYDRTTDNLPVLYLLHGYEDDETSWTSVGKAAVIADNLLADGRIEPLLIVMPYGQLSPSVSNDTAVGLDFQREYERQLLTEIIPAIESDYRAIPDAGHRAMAGNSMGGLQAAYVGMNHPELFSTIGMWSSAVFVEPSDLFARLASASSGLKNSFSYVQIAVGRQDPLYSGSAVIDDYLTAQGIAHEFTLTPGQHSWVTWRPYLVDFLQKFCASSET
jgi:enterochelin esterase-like enzyme